MTQQIDTVARAVLALAAVPPELHAGILREVQIRLDRQTAIERRDYWITRAAEIVGQVTILARLLHRYRSTAWPHLRHLPAPPTDETPLRQAFFWACQAVDDLAADLPGERQLRRIIS